MAAPPIEPGQAWHPAEGVGEVRHSLRALPQQLSLPAHSIGGWRCLAAGPGMRSLALEKED